MSYFLLRVSNQKKRLISIKSSAIISQLNFPNENAWLKK